MLFAVESGVPIPPIRRGGAGRKGTSIYNFDSLESPEEMGPSAKNFFHVAYGDDDPKKVNHRVQSAKLNYTRSNKIVKIKIRTKHSHNNELGVGVWRER